MEHAEMAQPHRVQCREKQPGKELVFQCIPDVCVYLKIDLHILI